MVPSMHALPVYGACIDGTTPALSPMIIRGHISGIPSAQSSCIEQVYSCHDWWQVISLTPAHCEYIWSLSAEFWACLLSTELWACLLTQWVSDSSFNTNSSLITSANGSFAGPYNGWLHQCKLTSPRDSPVNTSLYSERIAYWEYHHRQWRALW